jgi:hypothetical protein
MQLSVSVCSARNHEKSPFENLACSAAGPCGLFFFFLESAWESVLYCNYILIKATVIYGLNRVAYSGSALPNLNVVKPGRTPELRADSSDECVTNIT